MTVVKFPAESIQFFNLKRDFTLSFTWQFYFKLPP